MVQWRECRALGLPVSGVCPLHCFHSFTPRVVQIMVCVVGHLNKGLKEKMVREWCVTGQPVHDGKAGGPALFCVSEHDAKFL